MAFWSWEVAFISFILVAILTAYMYDTGDFKTFQWRQSINGASNGNFPGMQRAGNRSVQKSECE